MKYLSMSIAIMFFAMNVCSQETDSFTDIRDGKTYKTVKIGTQTWMAENLAYKAKTCWIYDNERSNLKIYGYLYDWETAKNACPSGWHLPSDAEWTVLTNCLGGDSIAGGKMKEKDTRHWKNPNTGATNESNFTALPSGGYFSIGEWRFMSLSSGVFWWSSSIDYSNFVMIRNIDYNVSKVLKASLPDHLYLSVRCVRDL